MVTLCFWPLVIGDLSFEREVVAVTFFVNEKKNFKAFRSAENEDELRLSPLRSQAMSKKSPSLPL